MRTRHVFTLTLFAFFAARGWVAAQGTIPPHPEKIEYPKFDYKIPSAAQFREVLSNGMVVYIAEDRMLPTFDLHVTIAAGGAFDPPAKVGLASITGEQMRDGGTQDLTPEQLDEKVEFLAARLTAGVGETNGSADLGLLSKDIDAGLELLVSMMRYPRFDETRFKQSKERRIQNFKRRSDSTTTIESSEFAFLLNGEEHFSNWYPTPATINAITREDMIAFHGKYVHPGNMMLSVAGDFDRKEMLKKLEKAFAGWPAGEKSPRSFEGPKFEPKPGVYIVHKADVNQGRVSVGHKGVLRGSPDEFALQVMNGILGASGFRSRIVARVRSDEGLAYNSGSQFGQGVYWPGNFRAWFQSKSNSCAYATQIVLEEIKRLRDEKVTQDDVDATINFYVESLPQRFESKMVMLETFSSDEFTGRDPKYWDTYVENLKKVTIDDVQRVAQKYLQPEKLVILAVGDADAVIAGGYDKAKDLKFDAFGKVTRLEPRNPETMKR